MSEPDAKILTNSGIDLTFNQSEIVNSDPRFSVGMFTIEPSPPELYVNSNAVLPSIRFHVGTLEPANAPLFCLPLLSLSSFSPVR